MTMERNDEDLARAARMGDLGAFRALVERHRGRIYSLALRMSGNRGEAEDMAQEAFIRIYRGLSSFRGESTLSTWMTRVALNTFHRYLHRMPRTQPLPDETLADAADASRPASASSVPDPEKAFLSRETGVRLRALVAGLPEPFRDAVTLFYLEDRSIDEASTALGVSSGTLKSRLFRAREMLLRQWETQEPGGAPAPAGGRVRP
jgi:RNA polymerase sigma-70 factor (ECF subfamily)